MYVTRVLIGPKPACLDQAIQTRKFNSLIRIKLGTLPCYFIKQLLNGFPCLDGLIQHLGIMLELRKASPSARVNSRNIPAFLDQDIQTRKLSSNCLL